MKYSVGTLLLLLLAGPAWAQDGDVTLEVVDNPGADENEYVEIALPNDTAKDATQGNADFGIGTANKAQTLGDTTKEEREQFGRDTANDAKALRQEGRDAVNAGRAVDGAGSNLPQDQLPVEVQ